ncbi:MAG: hypothetical protein ACYSR6_04255 [Planctomycetota bacterium]
MKKKRITTCLRYVATSLSKRIGISGLIGAGIGLAYIPLSIAAIGIAYTFEGNTFVQIITLPAVLFFVVAAYIDEIIGVMDVMDFPGILVPIVFFIAVGAGIGAFVHWTRNLIKKARASG